MRVALASFTLVLCASCANEVGDETLDITYNPCDALTVVPAPGTTAAELDGIERALEMWGVVLPIQIAVGGDDAGVPRLRIGFEEAAPVFHGVYRDEVGDILINRALDVPRERTITIAHEMGHAFGLWHVDESERVSVMNDGNLDVVPTATDAAVVSELWLDCNRSPVAHDMLPPTAQPNREEHHAQDPLVRSDRTGDRAGLD